MLDVVLVDSVVASLFMLSSFVVLFVVVVGLLWVGD